MPSKPVILVVDDDPPILALMRTLLREFGFTVDDVCRRALGLVR